MEYLKFDFGNELRTLTIENFKGVEIYLKLRRIESNRIIIIDYVRRGWTVFDVTSVSDD